MRLKGETPFRMVVGRKERGQDSLPPTCAKERVDAKRHY